MIGKYLLLVLGLMALASPSRAQPTSPVAKGPTGDDMITYYPKRAMNLGREGRAVIGCTVTEDRTLTDCAIVSEDPPGFEFGAAAIKLSSLFRMKVESEVGAKVQIPINFRLATGQVDQREWLSHLHFIAGPTEDDVERARPPMLTGPGKVTIRCHVKTAARLPQTERGTVYGCDAHDESPKNLGLAKAALSLAPSIRFEPSALIQGDPAWTVSFDMTWKAKPAG